ncbi:MAG: hypothetical protein ABI414_15040, partial [Devosia sp.]
TPPYFEVKEDRMATVKINDDAIWVKHIEGSETLRDRIRSLRAGDVVELEVDGIVGKWERMRDGRDGRPTLGIKPISHMKDVWAKLREHSGRIVELREVITADTYLRSLASTLSEWDSPEDAAAYADL